MSLQNRVYSVLVVSASESFNTAVSGLLTESVYSPVHFVSSISAARRASAERDFDFVIIHAPLPDELGTRFAIDLSAAQGTVVLLLVRSDIYAEIQDKVSEHGVFTLERPTSKVIMSTALDWMISARERLRRFEKKTLTIEEKMEEIRLVNRAKWLLISELKMDEPQAHRYIEKQAMDRCVQKLEIASEIIRLYS